MYNNYKKQDYNMPYSMLQTFQSCFKHSFHSTQYVYLGFANNESSHKDNLLDLAPKMEQERELQLSLLRCWFIIYCI